MAATIAWSAGSGSAIAGTSISSSPFVWSTDGPVPLGSQKDPSITVPSKLSRYGTGPLATRAASARRSTGQGRHEMQAPSTSVPGTPIETGSSSSPVIHSVYPASPASRTE